MVYTICIDETQREIITAALLAFDGSKFNVNDVSDITGLMADLKKEAEANPDVIHGLCY